MNFLVSIVITSFNKGKFIEEALVSVLEQSYLNIEIIVVDDHSTDTSLTILRKYEQEEKVRLVCLDENKGANFCRNKGLELSKGAYILFFDADDVMASTCVEKRVDFVSTQGELDFAVFKAYQFLDNSEKMHKELPADVNQDPLLASITLSNSWQTSQLFWNTSYVRSMGGFDASMKRFQDIELNSRVLFQNPNFKVSSDDADVFIRISNSRLTMSHYEFCKRTVESVIVLALKYQDKVLEKYKKPHYIDSLVFAMEAIELYVSNNAITIDQFEELSDMILNEKRIKKWSFINKRKYKRQTRKLLHNVAG